MRSEVLATSSSSVGKIRTAEPAAYCTPASKNVEANGIDGCRPSLATGHRWRTVRSEVLISRYFDFSSKLGRQKCRPFCLLEVTCLKNPSGPRAAHNRAPGKPRPIA